MTFKSACLTSTALLILSISGVNAGETTNDAGAIVCVNDKWDEKEVEKGHKLVDAVQRCVIIPNDPAAPKFVSDCVGKYEYMPDESWKASGTCTEISAKTRDTRAGKRVRTSRNTPTRSRVAPANTKVSPEPARTFTKIYPIPSRAAHTRAP